MRFAPHAGPLRVRLTSVPAFTEAHTWETDENSSFSAAPSRVLIYG